MAAVTATNTASDGAPSSPTGFETFLADSSKVTSAMVDGVEQVQGVITSYFPVKDACDGANNLCGDKSAKDASEEVPRLAASSSSDKSDKEGEDKKDEDAQGEDAKEEQLSWTEKISTCHMDTACGILDIECKNNEETPAGPAITEQGELLQIEGPPPPKPWTEEMSGKVQQAQKSTKKLLVSLGLVEKKDQARMTDFYKMEPAPAAPAAPAAPSELERTLSAKLQDVQANVSQTAQSVHSSVASSAQSASASLMSTLGLAPCEKAAEEEVKEKQQTLITDYDPALVASAAASVAKEEASVAKEEAPVAKEEVSAAESVTLEEAPVAELKREQGSLASVVMEPVVQKEDLSWKLWKQAKGFMSKFKMPKKTPTCEDIPAVPKFDVPSCPASPKAEDISSSLAMFGCNPKQYEAEPETKVVDETQEEVRKDTMPQTPKSPKESPLPW